MYELDAKTGKPIPAARGGFKPKTSHTLNPVPLHVFAPGAKLALEPAHREAGPRPPREHDPLPDGLRSAGRLSTFAGHGRRDRELTGRKAERADPNPRRIRGRRTRSAGSDPSRPSSSPRRSPSRRSRAASDRTRGTRSRPRASSTIAGRNTGSRPCPHRTDPLEALLARALDVGFDVFDEVGDVVDAVAPRRDPG